MSNLSFVSCHLRHPDSFNASLTMFTHRYTISRKRIITEENFKAAIFFSTAGIWTDLLRRPASRRFSSKKNLSNFLTGCSARESVFSVHKKELIRSTQVCGPEFGKLVLHYQPQFHRDGSLFGVEALARLQHPQRGLILPGEFIPLAEADGSIVRLGGEILRLACLQLAQWVNETGLENIVLSVNVSALQFTHPNFVASVEAIVRESGADPRRLVLEITETAMINDVPSTQEKMEALNAIGITFAIDDFGVGYSSLAYLKYLHFAQLKIDRIFIKDMLVHQCDSVIVKTIINLGTALGLTVIAEGVEFADQRLFLELNNCLVYQGYLFGKPQSAEKIQALGLVLSH